MLKGVGAVRSMPAIIGTFVGTKLDVRIGQGMGSLRSGWTQDAMIVHICCRSVCSCGVSSFCFERIETFCW